jgi:hypothetical protein
MQNLDVTAFINQQLTAPRGILSALRVIILQTAWHIEESMKYGLPYYSYHGRLCFLNLRGGTVSLGLCKGAFLANRQGLLEGAGKEVRHVRIKNLAGIDQAALQVLLQEAVLLNEMEKKRKS